jgi:hypothetical protein
VLTQLPRQRASQIGQLLPHRWQAPPKLQVYGKAQPLRCGQFGLAGRIGFRKIKSEKKKAVSNQRNYI